MPLILIIVGVILQILDRLFDKAKIVDVNDRLHLFISDYQPFLKRTQFLGILLLIAILSVIFDYLINQNVDLYNYLIILAILFSGPYLLILFVALFDYIFLKKTYFSLNFLMLELEFMQQFSLALISPVFALAYLVRALLLLLIYPGKGILVFKSFSGLLGFSFTIFGALIYVI